MSETELNKESEFYRKAQVKAKTNLVYISLFAVVMLFGGFTSAFLVSRGAGFWVSLQLPTSLTYSTITIAISSITMVLALVVVKKGNKKLAMFFLFLTLILGLGFGYFQFKGWGEIYQKGYAFTGTKILSANDNEEFSVSGEFGKDYELYFGGNLLFKDEGGFYYWGKKMIPIDSEEYQEFSKTKPKMVFGSELIELQENNEENSQNKYLAVVKFRYNLTENQQAKLADQSIVSASYFHVLTGAHLAHILIALFYLLYLIIALARGKYGKDYYLGIKLGGVFWHFLGLLWLYLFLFLYFIH